jgi:hypothetical protein
MTPVMAQAPSTAMNGGTQRLSDQFIAPVAPSVSPKSAPGRAEPINIVSQALIAPYVPSVPSKIPENSTLADGYSFDPCSCVSFVKAYRGITDLIGSPRKFWNLGGGYQNITPFTGLIVITREGPYWHMAYITKVTATTLEVTEANYVACKVTTRTIPLGSPLIMGYW